MPKRIDLLDRYKGYFIGETSCIDTIGCMPALERNAIIILFNKMKDYYEINDMESGLVHAEIFKALYMTEIEISFDDIAERFYIHTFTLDRYRQRYNKLAQKLIKKIYLK